MHQLLGIYQERSAKLVQNAPRVLLTLSAHIAKIAVASQYGEPRAAFPGQTTAHLCPARFIEKVQQQL
jgi:hypothetical protein